MPFMDFERMKKEMDHFWDSFFMLNQEGRGAGFRLSMCSETKTEIVVKAEVPGNGFKGY